MSYVGVTGTSEGQIVDEKSLPAITVKRCV